MPGSRPLRFTSGSNPLYLVNINTFWADKERSIDEIYFIFVGTLYVKDTLSNFKNVALSKYLEEY